MQDFLIHNWTPGWHQLLPKVLMPPYLHRPTCLAMHFAVDYILYSYTV